MAVKNGKRKDKDRVILRKGESQRKDGTYDFRWTSRNGKRHSIYAKTLEELRVREAEIEKDKGDGIRTEIRNVTVNDIFDLWCQIKRGLKDNTFQNYKYMYNQFVRPDFGRKRIAMLKKSDIRRFYNTLVDERMLKASTIDSIHTVLHQVLALAVDDAYLRTNPSDNALKELKQSHNFDTEKKKALTLPEQELLLDFLRRNHQYNHWYPVFAVMLGSGMRVGEATGLRWCDIDLEKGMIDINHTLVYYNHAENGCYFSVNTPKTRAGKRQIPMWTVLPAARQL